MPHSIEHIYDLFTHCTCVTTDSRRCPEGSLFVALRGANFNGNAYAAKALEQGSRYAVVDDPAFCPPGDERYMLTEDCLATLQQLARIHRRRMQATVIGITGTNGKTTTKELVAAVLGCRFRVLYTEGNLNNQIGVPLTLLRLQPSHEMAVVEMGASHPGDIDELVRIAEPDFGLITNVGKAHLQGFGSLAGVARTKGELYDYLRQQGGQVFVCTEQPLLMNMSTGMSRLTYGAEGEYLTGHAVDDGSPFLSVGWRHIGGSEHTVHTQLIGDYNLPNVLAAAVVGCKFGVDEQAICSAIAGYEPTNGRSQLVHTPRGNTIVVDAYNANPTSMSAAIDNFARLSAEHKGLILGDMRELGPGSKVEHQAVVDHLTECGFTDVYLVGTEFAATQHPFRSFPDVAALSAELTSCPPTGKTLLIKGSNGVRLQSVVGLL